jgi:transcription antitermination protein NusB
MRDPAGSEHRQRSGNRRRSVARLAAVQALYQLEANPETEPDAVIREFARHRFGEEIDDDRLGEADRALFADIVHGVSDDQEQLDAGISATLNEEWPLLRLDAVLRAILRAGAYELVHRRDVPPRVSLKEYTVIAHAFFTVNEPGLANGVINRIAHMLRAADL